MGLRLSTSITMAGVVLSTAANPALAGEIDVTQWHLLTALQDFSTTPTTEDSIDIFAISNPLLQTIRAQINSSYNESAFSYQWLDNDTFGTFETVITHAIRAPEVRTFSRSQIFITADEPIRVSVEGLLNYAHTPGDLTSLSFSASARDVATGDYAILEQRQGGNFYFLPSAGTLSFDGDAILSPGILYRLQYVLDCTNISDLLPTGILDAAGHVNFTISPVPEPATLTLLVPTLAATLLRCRRS